MDVFFRSVAIKVGPEEGFRGDPRIEDGCLLVGNYLVVWPAADDTEMARKTLSAALRGGATEIETGGDDKPLKDATQLAGCLVETALFVTRP